MSDIKVKRLDAELLSEDVDKLRRELAVVIGKSAGKYALHENGELKAVIGYSTDAMDALTSLLDYLLDQEVEDDEVNYLSDEEFKNVNEDWIPVEDQDDTFRIRDTPLEMFGLVKETEKK